MPGPSVDGQERGEGRIAMRVRGVSKTFPGVRALVDFDMDVKAGSARSRSSRRQPAGPRR
jgi:hypothetical protein